jgi:dihydrofolate reductase
MDDGLAAVAKVIAEEGPFDGVIGFSQGATMAAMVASLLEPGRKEAFQHFEKDTSEGAPGIPFPTAFEQLQHSPLKFALLYSGFRAPGARYRAFYENPPIQTPALHILGTLDSVDGFLCWGAGEGWVRGFPSRWPFCAQSATLP